MAYSGDIDFIGPAGSSRYRQWQYFSGSDFIKDVMVSGYFNSISDRLNVGDMIEVFGATSNRTIRVSSISGGVVTTNYQYAVSFGLGEANPGPMLTLSKTLPGGATTNTDLIVGGKFVVLYAIVELHAAGTTGDQIIIQDGSGNAISNTIDISSGTDKQIFLSTTIDKDYSTLVNGDTIRFREVDGGGSDSPAAQVTLVGATTY